MLRYISQAPQEKYFQQFSSTSLGFLSLSKRVSAPALIPVFRRISLQNPIPIPSVSLSY